MLKRKPNNRTRFVAVQCSEGSLNNDKGPFCGMSCVIPKNDWDKWLESGGRCYHCGGKMERVLGVEHARILNKVNQN